MGAPISIDGLGAFVFFMMSAAFFIAPLVGYGTSGRQFFSVAIWALLGIFTLEVLGRLILSVASFSAQDDVRLVFCLIQTAGFVVSSFFFFKGLQDLKKA
ncbi:MAG: hypothetical protein A2Z34_03810 [Planctomycetes bacterium RBG_16_59_8]|nr:MAG: hypothetical protein A2Z34_03810 [Planctomycetes bacterium RBG_16_59_8]